MSLVKKDIFEWIAQKATERGVSDIIPIIADRSEKKNLNTERLQKIIIEAAEQSGRSSLPVLHEICELDEVLGDSEKIWGNDSTLLVFDITAEKFSIEDVRHTQKIVVFIGPEGGWTPAEIETFKNTDIAIRSLGPQVLRAETAVVAALAQLVF